MLTSCTVLWERKIVSSNSLVSNSSLWSTESIDNNASQTGGPISVESASSCYPTLFPGQIRPLAYKLSKSSKKNLITRTDSWDSTTLMFWSDIQVHNKYCTLPFKIILRVPLTYMSMYSTIIFKINTFCYRTLEKHVNKLQNCMFCKQRYAK